MAEITLVDLGLNKEDIAERVIDRIVEKTLTLSGYDEDGNVTSGPETTFAKTIKATVVERVNKAVEEIAGKHVLPNIATYVENLTMQETNRWGEKTKQSLTFREYLVQRCEKWLVEEVDFEGRPKGADSYNWKAHQTRIAHMVHHHLHYNISNAMAEAVKSANSQIALGIQETVKIKLAEIAAGIKTSIAVTNP